MNARVEYLPLVERRESATGAISNALFGGVLRWYRRRVAINSLRALPDYLLNDIGVNRASIPSVVDGLVR